MTVRFNQAFDTVPADSVDFKQLDKTYSSVRTSRRRGFYRRYGKRSLDIALVLLSAPLVLLVMLPMIAMVALDGGRPFYSQMRVGVNGSSYRMWKLRSMVHNAEEKLSAYLATNKVAKEEWDRDQKLKNDPRITKVGRIIRKTSLDELPQLWNVLKGEMSIVGPRPMMINQRRMYPGKHYFALRPGITGAWQISARNESTFAERAEFDAGYSRSLSFKEDLRIISATVGVVAKGTGH